MRSSVDITNHSTMKPTQLALVSVLGVAAADNSRYWNFYIDSASGPGCYWGGEHPLTLGINGQTWPLDSELQKLSFDYQALAQSLGPKAGDTTWCDVTVSYAGAVGQNIDESRRLVVHSNGTTITARYALDSAASLRWDVSYVAGKDGKLPTDQVDTINVSGPLTTEVARSSDLSSGLKLPICGQDYFKFRTQLTRLTPAKTNEVIVTDGISQDITLKSTTCS
jgi:hypothetical protein